MPKETKLENGQPLNPEDPQNPASEPEFALSDDGELIINEPSDDPAPEPEPTDEPVDTPDDPDPGEEDEEDSDPPGDNPPADPTDKDGEGDAYTPDDIRETDFENIDVSKLPEPLQKLYKGMQASYTKKMQSISRSQPQQAQPQNFQTPQPGPQAQDAHQKMTPEDARKYLFDMAKDEACRMLSIKRDDFDELNPEHVATLSTAHGRVYDMARNEAMKQQKVQQAQVEYQNFMVDLRSKDPNFDEISNWGMKYVVDELPYKEYTRVMNAFESADIDRIKEVVNEIREEWYKRNKKEPAKKRKKVAPPPVVEPGSSSNADVPTPPDPRELRNMSDDDIAKWLVDNGIASL